MNIENNKTADVTQPVSIKNNQRETQEEATKKAAKNLFIKARRELTPNGDEKIIEPFSFEGRNYILYIIPSEDKKNPERKTLSVAYLIEEEGDMASMALARGTKQEILDYLGDERNLAEIMSFSTHLYSTHVKS